MRYSKRAKAFRDQGFANDDRDRELKAAQEEIRKLQRRIVELTPEPPEPAPPAPWYKREFPPSS